MNPKAKLILIIAGVVIFVALVVQAFVLISQNNERTAAQRGAEQSLGGQQAGDGQQAASLQSGRQYNVIIVAFDGLQARHLREYGYEQDTTPNLDRFFADSYVFTNTVSPAPWTVPSFMSMFTSMYPSEHRMTNKFVVYDPKGGKVVKVNLTNLTPQAVTLAQVMKENGYATAGFTGDAGITGSFGYAKGFDTYYDATMFGGLDQSMPMAEDWLKANKDKPFFLFVHGYDVHGQHAPAGGFDYRYVRKPYRGNYTGSITEQGALREASLRGELNLSDEDVRFWRAIYDEKISRADEEFGGFLQQVDAMGLANNTIIIVVSDHGTEFYEHHGIDHGHTLYGELEETVFAVHTPGQTGGTHVQSLVSTLDLMPTTLALVGLRNATPATAKGIDLTPTFTGADLSRPIYMETDLRLYTHKRGVQRPDGMKFILTLPQGTKEMYNLSADRLEQRNLVGEQPALAYEMEQQVRQHMKEVGDSGPWLLGCLPVYNDQCQNLTAKQGVDPKAQNVTIPITG